MNNNDIISQIKELSMNPCDDLAGANYALGLIFGLTTMYSMENNIPEENNIKECINEPVEKKTFEDFVKDVKDKGGVLTSDGYSSKENLENYRTMSLREEIYTRIAVKEHANMLWRQCCGYGINNMIGLVEWFDDPSHTNQNMKDISNEDYKTLLAIYRKGCRRPEESMSFYDYLLYIARVMNISKSSATRTCNALAKSNIYTVRQLKYYCKEHNVGKIKNIGDNGIMLCKYILTHD